MKPHLNGEYHLKNFLNLCEKIENQMLLEMAKIDSIDNKRDLIDHVACFTNNDIFKLAIIGSYEEKYKNTEESIWDLTDTIFIDNLEKNKMIAYEAFIDKFNGEKDFKKIFLSNEISLRATKEQIKEYLKRSKNDIEIISIDFEYTPYKEDGYYAEEDFLKLLNSIHKDYESYLTILKNNKSILYDTPKEHLKHYFNFNHQLQLIHLFTDNPKLYQKMLEVENEIKEKIKPYKKKFR